MKAGARAGLGLVACAGAAVLLWFLTGSPPDPSPSPSPSPAPGETGRLAGEERALRGEPSAFEETGNPGDDSAPPEGEARLPLPAASGDVVGSVRGPDGEVPDGVRVWIVPTGDLRAEDLQWVWANKRAAAYFTAHRLEAAVAEDGSFIVEKVPPGSYLAVAWAPGFARAHALFEHARETASCDLSMEKGQVLRGTVVNSSGDPIPGATVEVQRDYHSGAGTTYTEPAGEIFATVSYREVARTGLHGRFRVDTLDRGHYFVWASAPDYSEEGAGPLRIPEQGEVSLRLFQAGVVEGIVRDGGGNPIPDVLLWCGLYLEPGVAMPISWTGPDGRFRVEHVPVGPVSLICSKPPYAVKHVPVGYLERGTTRSMAVVLEEGTSIRGRVTDPQNQGVSGMRITAVSRDGNLTIRVVRTDPSGAFELLCVPRSEPDLFVYTLRAQERGLLDAMVLAKPGDQDVVLRVQPYATLEGRVVDAATGDPVTSFQVRVVGEADARGPTDEAIRKSSIHKVESLSGSFRVGGLSPGRVRVFLTASGYARFERGGVMLPEEGPGEALLVELQPGGVLEGRVVTETAHLPAAEARIALLESVEGDASGIPGLIETKSDPQGSFRLTGLGVGRPTLLVQHPGFPDTIVEGPRIDRPGEVEAMEIVLGEGGSLEGLALDEAGRPDRLARAEVWLRDTWGQGDRRTFIDEQGRFRFEDLSPGLWTVGVGQTLGEAWLQRSVTIRAGETSRVVFDRRLQGRVQGEVFRGGQPVSQAQVWLQDLDPRRGRSGDSDYGFAVTDDQGQFSIEGVEEGAYELSVSEEGTESQVTRRVQVPSGGPVEVRVELGASHLSGIVVDPATGLGIEHAIVRIYDALQGAAGGKAFAEGGGGRGPFSLAVHAQGACETDASGRFRIENVSPGAFDVLATANGYGASAWKTVDVGAGGEEGLMFALSRECLLRVAVADARGGGIAKAGVYVHDAASGRLLARDLAGLDGTVEFGRLPEGEVLVTAAKPGFAAGAPARVAVHPASRASVAIELGAPREAVVQVVGEEDGRGVPSVAVDLRGEGGLVRRRIFRGNWVRDERGWVTDEAGRCLLDSLSEGRYEVSIEVAGERIQKTLVVPRSGAPQAVTFVIPAGGS